MLFLLFAALTFGLLVPLLSYSYYIRVSVITLTPISVPIIVPLAVILVWPFEKLIYNHYKSKCKKELKNHTNLIKIGITGSYGKTSTKVYLQKFLEKKYKVCATPASYNTPMGVSKVVFNQLKDDDEVFIVEMGAKKIGDIKELCDMVGVDAGIITAVGEQHLDTFKNLQNIIKTKTELVDALKEDAYCVFNVASENTKTMFDNCNLKNKIAVSEPETYLYAKDIVATCDGLEFVLCFDGKEYQTHTEILGEHNIQNILSAAALAIKFGILS